ncbi:TonB-dependent receptor plug domain-containing protein [Anthocerotibacter panamensis]|uniref:TonB-dependent receptor plug domain-containing protein n=1 Tax=Anthocerotibacter panamensis TaxID=2857077 RepID=UPI001C408A47|nr:TonB-dependent receptor [Anthocerotibacter panamensis]
MSYFSRKGRKKSASLFSYSACLFCLTLVSTITLGAVQAEETPVVAEARALTPTGNNAKDLLGISGSLPTTWGEQASAISPASPALLSQQTTNADAADEGDEPVDLLSEFNVTAQRRKTTERENTQVTYVVNKDDIKAAGAANISDALKLVPGFALAEALGGIDNRGLNTFRGFDDQRFILLQDGRPLVRSSNERSSDISKLPVLNVERVEVVTGGGTLRYGPDAVGGVINIITTIPEGPPKLSAKVQFGSYGFSNYSLDYSGSNGDASSAGYFAYQLGYTRQSVLNNAVLSATVNDPFGGGIFVRDRVNGQVTVTNVGSTYTSPLFERQQFYAFSDFYYGKVIFKPGKDHTVTVYAQQQNTRRGISPTGTLACGYYPVGYQGVDPASLPYVYCFTGRERIVGRNTRFGDAKEDQFGLNATWDWNLSELNTLSTQVSLNSSFGDTSGQQRLVSNRVLEANIRYTAQLYPGNILNAGFVFNTQRSNQSFQEGAPLGVAGPGGFIPFDIERNSWAIYITEDLKFFDDALIVNFGSRLTDDNRFGTFTTSAAGIRYNFGGPKGRETFGLRANYQQAFKIPGLSQLGAVFTVGAPIPTQISLPNPALAPENSTGYDIGLDVAISPSVAFRATYYRTDLTNSLLEGTLVSINQIPNGTGGFVRQNIVTSINAQAQKVVGWDFVLDWAIDPQWKLAVTESLIDSTAVGIGSLDLQARNGLPEAGGGFLYGYATAGIPFTTTGLRISYTSPGFTGALSANFVGETPIIGTLFQPAYNVVDFTTSVPLGPTLTLTGGVFDIFANSGRIRAPGLQTFRFGLEASL